MTLPCRPCRLLYDTVVALPGWGGCSLCRTVVCLADDFCRVASGLPSAVLGFDCRAGRHTLPASAEFSYTLILSAVPPEKLHVTSWAIVFCNIAYICLIRLRP